MEQRSEDEVRPLVDLAIDADGDVRVAASLEAVFLEEVVETRVLVVAFERLLAAVLLCRMDSLAPHGFALDDIVEQVDVTIHLVFAFEAT